MYLTGRSLVLVWMVSLLLHVVALAVMFFVMFPYAPKRQTDLAVTRAELIGDLAPASFTSSKECQSREPAAVDPDDGGVHGLAGVQPLSRSVGAEQ